MGYKEVKTITINDMEHEFSCSLGMLLRFQRKSGMKLTTFQKNLALVESDEVSEEDSIKTWEAIPVLFWAGLSEHNPEITVEDVEAMLPMWPINELRQVLAIVADAVGVQEEAPNDNPLAPIVMENHSVMSGVESGVSGDTS